MKKHNALIVFAACLAALSSCGKDPQPVNKPPVVVKPDPNVNSGGNENGEKEIDYSKAALGDLAAQQGIRLGAAFTYGEYRNNAKVKEILTREFKAVTFGNEMKHDAIVRSDGSMNFTTADQMAQWAKDAGTELFGHVLGWHSQQQTAYLNKVINQATAGQNPMNPAAIDGGIDFEKYSAGGAAQLLESGEFLQINGQDYVSVVSGDAKSGSLSLKMDNASGHATNSWDVQVVTKAFPVTAGKTYIIAWWGRASKAAGMMVDIRGDGDTQYRNASLGTAWGYQSLEYTVQTGQELSIGFFGATEAAAYFLDDIQIYPKEAGGGADEAVCEALDAALKSYIFGMVEHFDVYAWDVVNETFADGGNGAFRTRGGSDKDFVWGNYYPSTKDWVDHAFAYATEACAQYGKKPVLYINDYNLETDAGKRKGLCNYAKNNPLVTGVASQMHLDINTPDLKGKIEATLKDLTATGKIVRISELDLKNDNEAAQADLFKFIFQKYLEIVPAAQRGGITFWGINDKDSWVGEQNHPLVWKGVNYEKKKAYEALYLYLCELNGINPYKE